MRWLVSRKPVWKTARRLTVEKYRRGSEMHHAFDRNEILEIVLEHRASLDRPLNLPSGIE
jgi:hypothetical protein